jgi:hypothetical protein
MRRLMSVCLISAAACAGSSPTPGATPDVEQRIAIVGAGTSSLNVVSGSDPATHELAVPLDRVWKVLPAVFDSIAVPVALLDPQSHTIGNRGFKLRGKLGKVGLARYIDCGTTQIGPNAESYDINLTVTTALKATPGGATAMSIVVQASARPMAFAQDPFPCSTKGSLEQRIQDLTTALISR